MDRDLHFLALEKMYAAGPINELFQPVLEVGEGVASIDMEVSEQFFHAGGALHGSVYFKMLDDAAFFAANSLERERFVLTTSFTLYLTGPVTSGRLRAVGRVVHRTRSQFIAEAVLTDSAGDEVARGSGVFVRSRIRLADTPGYEP
jgi:uncharacterized protein (TIGR00369 family)